MGVILEGVENHCIRLCGYNCNKISAKLLPKLQILKAQVGSETNPGEVIRCFSTILDLEQKEQITRLKYDGI